MSNPDAGSAEGGQRTDAGGLLLREVAVASDLLRQFSTCFLDCRNQRLVERAYDSL